MFIYTTNEGFILRDVSNFRKLELDAAGRTSTALANLLSAHDAFQVIDNDEAYIWIDIDWLKRQLDVVGVGDWRPSFAGMIDYAAVHGWISESGQNVRVHVTNLGQADVVSEPDAAAFRNGMALLSGSVNIVTTDGPGGRGGLAATAVCSVTDEPPTLLVCINRNSSSYPALNANGVLCVNVLGRNHEDLAARFGSKISNEERFENGEWERGSTGAPILQGATVAFDCQIAGRAEVGTHDVLFCEVKSVVFGGDESGGLVYFNRQFCGLPLNATCG